jgi:hypothetical protein
MEGYVLTGTFTSKRAPTVSSTGAASWAPPDRLFRLLGWIGIGLGALEILAPKAVTKSIGMQGNEDLVRAYGAHEMATGILLVSGETPVGFWSRLAGDGLNAALLVSALRRDNPKRGMARFALAILAGLTVLDLAHAAPAIAQPDRKRNQPDRPDSGGQGPGIATDPAPVS